MDIKSLFKKKEKNKLLVNWKWEGTLQKSNDILEPCSKNMPPYWKGLSKNFSPESLVKYRGFVDRLNQQQGVSKEERKNINTEVRESGIWNLGNNVSRINASSCPSFVEIFKNSYVYKAPCDLYVKIDNKGWDITSRNKKLFDIASHSLPVQLWKGFNDNISNIKFQSDLYIQTSLKNSKIIFLDNIYHSDLPFSVMPGVAEVSSKFAVNMNLNTFIDRRKFLNNSYKKIIKAGTVLALIYMPDGILPIKDCELSPSPPKHFIGDYFKKLKKN